MKPFLLLAALLFFSNLSHSQGDLSFTYDASGNQILRTDNTANKSMPTTVEEKDSIEERKLDNPFFEEQIKVSAAPNPVRNTLTTTWENKEDEYFIIASVYSYQHRLLRQKKLSKSQATETFSFSSYPQGIYILVFMTNHNKKQSYKIIKK